MLNKKYKKIFTVLFFFYPLLVFVGVKYFDTTVATLTLSAVLILRLTFLRNKNNLGSSLDIILGVILINNLLNLYFKNELILKLHPVFMSFGMSIAFFHSVIIGSPVLEKIARQFEKIWTVEKSSYVRKLTILWSCWLSINGCIALYTVLYCSLDVWLIYNNLISYMLTGVWIVAEISYRKLFLSKRFKKEVENVYTQ